MALLYHNYIRLCVVLLTISSGIWRAFKGDPKRNRNEKVMLFLKNLSIHMLFICLSAHSVLAEPCDVLMQGFSKQDWNPAQFTSPIKYHPKNFKFLIHKLTPMGGDFSKHVLGLDDKINLLKNPAQISKVKAFSASVINQDKRVTYSGAVGLILKAPSKNIVATRAVDMQTMTPLARAWKQSPESLENLLKNYKEYYGVRSPDQILEETHLNDFNEILIRGTGPDGEKVKVVGFALFDINGMLPLMPGEEQKILNYAQANQLPVVRISWDGKMNFEHRLKYENEGMQFYNQYLKPSFMNK